MIEHAAHVLRDLNVIGHAQRVALFLVALVGIVYASKRLRSWTVAHLTILSDLPDLGTSRKDGEKLQSTAIICGGSIAGLLTARICADHCTRVVVLDPDATELVESARAADAMRNLPQHPRVMQYNAGHAFQGIYHYAMTRLFPGRVESELADADAFVGRADYNLSFGGIYISSVVDQLPVPARVMVGSTRACQETLLRRLVAQDKRIEFIDGTLTGFNVDPTDSSRLKGVSYRRTGGSRDVISLQGDLIVDCTGVAHLGLTLLRRIPSFSIPNTALESYHPHVQYAIGKFKNATAMLKPFLDGTHECDKGSPFPTLYVPVAAMENRWFSLQRIEQDTLIIWVGGIGFTSAVESVADLRAQAHSLRGVKPLPDWLFDVLDNLEAQEAEYPAEFTRTSISAMHMIKYHQHISMVPSNFVAVGDSWMRLNPVWGQGATMAMIQATSLDATLRAVSATSQSKLAIAPAYFKKIDTLLGGVWDDTKAHDYVYEACDTVPGDSRQIGAWSMVYERAIEKRATRGDVDLQRRMIGVTSWVLPPTDMITPGVLAKVALDWVLGR